MLDNIRRRQKNNIATRSAVLRSREEIANLVQIHFRIYITVKSSVIADKYNFFENESV